MPTDDVVLSTVPEVAGAIPPRAAPARCLHCEPPLTPARFVAGRRLRTGLAVVFVALAIAAFVDNGAVLLTWDEPIQRAVESRRTAAADGIFRAISFLGSTRAVLFLACVLAALAWRRCRAVGVVVVLAMLSRPLLEFTLKASVGRDRPDMARLVAGNGPSFPSGHVMAAVALWGLVPLVAALYTRDRRVWWATVAGSGALILAIGASRMYLGVHWFSDVVGGLIVGAFFLVGVEWVLVRNHRQDPCTRGCRCHEPTAVADRRHVAASRGAHAVQDGAT
jgi:undecaprenyl-diphosphatase